jgi:hypothetical protein
MSIARLSAAYRSFVVANVCRCGDLDLFADGFGDFCAEQRRVLSVSGADCYDRRAVGFLFFHRGALRKRTEGKSRGSGCAFPVFNPSANRRESEY